MKKRIMSLLIALCMATSIIIIPNTAMAATYGNLTYTISNDEVTITGCNTSASGELEIPQTIEGYPVTSIANYAFEGYAPLTSITIPDSVTSIGRCAFSGCFSLESITILGSIASIEDGTFADCFSLTSITIPDSVTSIGAEAFGCCENLTSITIPKNVTSIGETAFLYCSNLKSITMFDSLKSIGDFAFYSCDNLTDVYYTGSEEDRSKILISGGNDCLIYATIHYNHGIFDKLFSGSAYDYNHSLARLTFDFVEAGFSATTDDFAKGGSDTSSIAKKRYANIKNKYDEYGFTTNQKFYNYGIALTDTSDKAAYSIASRDIMVNGKTKKLVALVVRGGKYGGEWVSNFNVGRDSTYSQGFKKPADDITEKLKSYISAYKSKDVVLWMTGYSRGAAIANLVAANMVDYSQKCSCLNSENIFTYTFATPRPVHVKNANAANEKYNNIFNIVNAADAVPYVLLSDWGFGRYGITKTIISNAPTQVKSHYKEITGNTYSISQDQRSAVSNLVKLLSNLADSKQEFSNKYAEPIKDIVHWLMVDKEANENASLIEYATTKYASGDVVRCYQYASGDVEAYKRVLKKAGINDEYIKLIKEIGTILELNGISVDEFFDDLTGNNALSLLKSVLRIISSVSSLNGQFAGLGAVHEPDTYRAWLFGLDDPEKIYITSKSAGEVFNENANKYKKQLIQCPVDVEITDADGNVVVSVVNHEILIDELPVVVVDDKIKIFYYDNFEDYDVKITAYEEGEVNYYVSEYAVGAEETKRVCYNNIEVCANETLTGTVNDEIDTDVANYDLILSENTISNTEVLANEELENLSVTITSEGSGVAADITEASKGDYVTVNAEPFAGAEFIGWYDGEVYLSENAEYSFVIEESRSLIAKFTVTDAEISDVSVPKIEDRVISSSATITANEEVEGVLVFNAYAGDTHVTEYRCNVSMSAGETETFESQFDEDGAINRITACLYNNSGVAKTAELSVCVVRDLLTGENDEYKYIIYPDDTVEITQIKAMVGETFEIPTVIDGYTVFALGENLFKDNVDIKEVTVPDTVSLIRTSAFLGCENLGWINFKGSMEEWNCMTLIGDDALPETVSIATSITENPASIHSIDFTNENEKEIARVNFDYVKEKAKVYFVLYDTNGEMTSIKAGDVFATDKTAGFELGSEDDIENSLIKVFCWSETGNLKPLSKVFKYNE